MSIVERSFYCLNCGNKGMTCWRSKSKLKEKFHRKKLYCPTCKLTCQHIECRNDAEVYEFKELFNEGIFKEEAATSIEFVEKEDKWLYV